MTSSRDYPLWVPGVMFIGFLVFFSSMPAVIDESEKIVALRDIPFGWLVVPAALQVLLFSIGLRVYEWSEFGDEERAIFLRRLLVLSVVALCAWYGGFLLAAARSWDYDTAVLVSMIPTTVLAILWFIQKPRKELWD